MKFATSDSYYIAFYTFFSFSSLSFTSANDIVWGMEGKVKSHQAVTYNCDFISLWNDDNFDTLPKGGAHWSQLITASHSENYEMWSPGSISTKAFEKLAEDGSVKELKNEMDAAGDKIGNYVTGAIRGLKLDVNHPYMSSATMIAPSPDWFAGFHDVKPVGENGFWYDEFDVTAYPYDAGTEEGTDYKYNNDATNPQEPIFVYTPDIQSPFITNRNGTDVIPPVARFECSRIQDEGPGTFMRRAIKSNVDSSRTVQYDVQLVNMWNENNHPNDFPNNPHYSWPVIVSHNSKYEMWNSGMKASPGVKQVAEVGAYSKLKDEIAAAGTDALDTIVGRVGLTQMIRGLTMDKDHFMISAITMIAPSPDWFTGFHGMSAKKGNKWLKSFDIVVFPYDAGTDSGTSYNSANMPTQPREDIYQLTPSSVPENSRVFVKGDRVRAVAVFKFTLDESSVVCEDDESHRFSKNRTCQWISEAPWRVRFFCKWNNKKKCPATCGDCIMK